METPILNYSKQSDSLRYLECKDIVFIDYLQNVYTVNGEYYAKLLRELRMTIKIKRSGKQTKGVLFHQDHAPCNEVSSAEMVD